jgi:hypothetical protein
VPTVEYNANDTDQVSFVREATRYYQIYVVDLGALAASLVEQLEPVAHARSIELRCVPPPAVAALGDRGLAGTAPAQPARHGDEVHARRWTSRRPHVVRWCARQAGGCLGIAG